MLEEGAAHNGTRKMSEEIIPIIEAIGIKLYMHMVGTSCSLPAHT